MTQRTIVAKFFVDGRYSGLYHAKDHEQLNDFATQVAACLAPQRVHVEIPVISDRVYLYTIRRHGEQNDTEQWLTEKEAADPWYRENGYTVTRNHP